MANILRITQDYVILYKTIPENEGVLSIDAVFPPLMKGDLVEWVDMYIEFPKSILWVAVKHHLTRVNESVGFVKIMYLEHYITVDENSTILPEVIVKTKPIMDKVLMESIIRFIKKSIKSKQIPKILVAELFTDFFQSKPSSPYVPFYYTTNIDLILKVLHAVHYYHNMDEFSYILLRLEKVNVLTILKGITLNELEKYPETVIRLLFSLPLQDVSVIILQELGNGLKKNVKKPLKDKGIEEIAALISKLTKIYKRTAKDFSLHQDKYVKRIEIFFSDFLRMRFYQLEYTMDILEDNGIVAFLDEMDFFVDIIFEIFFAKEIKNENLILFSFYFQLDARDIIHLWSLYVKGRGADFDMPLLVLKKDGNRSTDIKLRKVFDYDYKVLKDGKKYSEGFFADMAESITKPIEDLKPKKAENTEDKKGLTAVAFFRIADAIKTSFMTDWIKLLNSRPNLLPMLNKVIKDKFQKEAYTKLSDGIKYKFNQNTIATDLSILNKINWKKI